MLTSLIALVALAQEAVPVQTPPQPFVSPLTEVQLDRLALTPVLDGKINPEEWDPFYSETGFDSFFQWQPRQLHFAATLPVGKDLIVSLDLKGDGWLVGKDNVEIRATWDGTAVKTLFRGLDATRKSGPAWVESENLQKCVKSVATAEPATWTVELTMEDPGTGMITKVPRTTVGLRMDAWPTETADVQPYLPRVTVPAKLGYERSKGLVEGLQWKPEVTGRAVIPGGRIRIRHTFKGNDELGLKRIEMRTEGTAEEATTTKAQPFPSFDRKSRAFVDYETQVASEAAEGFRIARATVQNAEGEPAVMQVSYEISPALTFDFNVPEKLKPSDEEQKYRFSVYLRSNVSGRLDGSFVVVPPDGWKVDSGSDKEFIIYGSRSSVRRAFELVIPAGAEGVFPLKLVADFGKSRVIERTFWISLQ